MDGIVNIDKPVGLSSRRTVSRVSSSAAGVKKAGHGGTLDPQAGGVLIVLLGEACKLSRFFLKQDKSYRARIKLGYFSDTLDSAGKIIQTEKFNLPGEDEVRKTVNGFKGRYRHLVPEYSAKKHKGETFYKIKRSGRIPPERFQETCIYDIKTIDCKNDVITIQLNCSSGTYIRSLAADIAKKLGTAGYLESLRRTKVADFRIKDSAGIDNWKDGFIDINEAARKFKYVSIKNKSARKVKNGIIFKESDIIQAGGNTAGSLFAVFSEDYILTAIAKSKKGKYSLERVFNL